MIEVLTGLAVVLAVSIVSWLVGWPIVTYFNKAWAPGEPAGIVWPLLYGYLAVAFCTLVVTLLYDIGLGVVGGLNELR